MNIAGRITFNPGTVMANQAFKTAPFQTEKRLFTHKTGSCCAQSELSRKTQDDVDVAADDGGDEGDGGDEEGGEDFVSAILDSTGGKMSP